MSLQITRGDSQAFSISVVDQNGNTYKLQEGDVAKFTVKAAARASEPVIMEKTMNCSSGFNFKLTAQDTSVPTGCYVYDVELRTANGDVCTVVKPSTIEILPEVTSHD